MPLRDVVRLHASSGTTGQATVVGYTRNDLRTWAELTARVLVAGGVTRDDVVQIAFDYGLFTGAFGLHYGAERLGASVIPVSSADAAPPGGHHARLPDHGAGAHPEPRPGHRRAALEVGVSPRGALT